MKHIFSLVALLLILVVAEGTKKPKAKKKSATTTITPPPEDFQDGDYSSEFDYENQETSRSDYPKVVGEPPVFTNMKKMAEQKTGLYSAGNTVTLKCPATGSPRPQIFWTKDGSVITRKLAPVTITKWQMRMADLIESDSGNYTCTVINEHGTINFTFELNVKETNLHKPVIEESPKNITVMIGQTAEFTCRALADLATYMVWTRAYKSVENGTHMERMESESNDTNPEQLVLHNVTMEDAGWYTCIVGNTLGHSHKAAYLNVIEVALTTGKDNLENSTQETTRQPIQRKRQPRRKPRQPIRVRVA